MRLRGFEKGRRLSSEIRPGASPRIIIRKRVVPRASGGNLRQGASVAQTWQSIAERQKRARVGSDAAFIGDTRFFGEVGAVWTDRGRGAGSFMVSRPLIAIELTYAGTD